MTVDEALQIIKDEHLSNYMLYTTQRQEHAVAIIKQDPQWITFVTEEMGRIFDTSYRNFDSESDALDDFVERLRGRKIVADIDREWAAEDAERKCRARDASSLWTPMRNAGVEKRVGVAENKIVDTLRRKNSSVETQAPLDTRTLERLDLVWETAP